MNPPVMPSTMQSTAERGLDALKNYRAVHGHDRRRLDVGLRAAVFLASWFFSGLLCVGIGALAFGPAGAPIGAGLGTFLGLGFAAWASQLLSIAAQWERAVILRFGKYLGTKGPGLLVAFPVADHVIFVDTRLLALEVPHQQVITKDNVPVRIDGVLFFQVHDPRAAVVSVQDFRFATVQYAKAALRDVIGSMTLDELLSERDQIQQRVAGMVDERTKAIGIHVDSIRLLDLDVPEELKRMMSRQASAEREKRATITKAEGDKEAARNLADAAATMSSSPGAMQLRALQTLDGLGASPSNTVVLGLPVELLELARSLKDHAKGSDRI